MQPEQLRIAYMKEYLLRCIQQVPILAVLLAMFLSQAHQRKVKSGSTKPQWLTWASFYQSFLVDVFMRARQAKAVRLTTMLISVFLLMTGISESGWRLLQRLRIVAAKESVEAFVRGNSSNTINKDSFLMYVFDNCDFKRHVTNVRTSHRTEMMHVVTR